MIGCLIGGTDALGKSNDTNRFFEGNVILSYQRVQRWFVGLAGSGLHKLSVKTNNGKVVAVYNPVKPRWLPRPKLLS